MSSILPKKSYLVDFDRILLATVFVLTVFGIYLQFNIATSMGDNLQMSMFLNQLRSLFIAIFVFCIVFFIPNLSKLLYHGSFWYLLLVIGLLIYVLLFGISEQGSTRWMRLVFFSFQPSQLVHPVLIVFFAKYFERKRHLIANTGFFGFLNDFKLLVILTIGIMALILLQPHLSTIIVLSLTLLAMIFVADFKKTLFFMLILIVLVGSFILINLSHDYRPARMVTYTKYSLFHKFMGVEQSKIAGCRDRDYQVVESLTAITQGGLIGTGSERGRAKHKFLPDVNSDYIFAMIAEQFGFIGGLLVLLLFSLF